MSSSAGPLLPLYRLVTPTNTVTIAGASTSANTTFNTNIPIGSYMNIRRARVIIALKIPIEASSLSEQLLYELTEDTNKTAVAQKDPFALLDGGIEVGDREVSAVGEISYYWNLVKDDHKFDPPHPGVPTVAQQLNLVSTGVRVNGSSLMVFDTFIQLYYEILPVTEQIRSFLTNRIVLQRTT